MTYGYKIAPPALIGTMAAMTGSVNWVIAKGLASFIGGQLIDAEILTIVEVFIYGSAFCGVWAGLFYFLYLVIGRKKAQKLINRNEAERLEMEGKNKENNENDVKNVDEEDDKVEKFASSVMPVSYDSGRYTVTKF